MTASRPRCPDCALPLRTCLCALVAPVANRVRVLVLQHPAEADEAKGSVRLMSRSLAACEVLVGERFEPAELARRLVTGSALLYPDVTGPGPEGAAPQALAADVTQLVVLDGTWRKSLRMLHANPLLQSLPRWAIAPSAPTRYAALRKARRPAQLSTLEAACGALADIEAAPARYEPLLAAFERFVADRASRARAAP